jgi:ribose 5-phosphate isomerase B
MRIYIGTDHAGLAQKEKIKEYLKENGYDVIDLGANEYDEVDDYPDFVIPVAKEVSKNPQNTKGIILGGSGQGEAMCANRFPYVRAAVFYGHRTSLTSNVSNLELSRQHNDANVLAIGSRFVSDEEAVQAVHRWLEAPFSEGMRHKRRLVKFDRMHD